MDEQPDRATDEELSRSDMRTVRGAVRRKWDIPPEVRKRLLQAALNIADLDNVDDIRPRPSTKTRLAAMKVVQAFQDLDLREEALALAREKHEGKTDRDVTLADVVRAAEQRAEERRRERDEG